MSGPKFKWNFTDFEKTVAPTADSTYMGLVRSFLYDLDIPDMKQGPWLAGGTLRRLYEGQLYRGADFDLFFQSEEQKNGVRDFIVEQWDPEVVFDSENAITYKMYYNGHMVTIQLIHRKYYNMPSDVIADFDIVACQMVTDGKVLVHGQLTLDNIEKRLLRVNQSVLGEDTYSANHTLRRMIKMGEDGYRMGEWHVNEFLKFVAAHPEVIKDEKPMSPEVTTNPCVDFDLLF